MAAIGLMILVSSFLATGATRVEVRATDTYWRSHNFCYCPFKLFALILTLTLSPFQVYQSHVGRVGGRVATAVFIFLVYILLVAWLVVLFFCIIVTTFYSLSWGE